MPHVTGIVTAGIPEATRTAHALIHRGAEAGIVVAAGARADAARAERLPEAHEGTEVATRDPRQGAGGGHRGHAGAGRRDEDPPDLQDAGSGGLVDLQA
ncbi:MAG: hypothetical protein AB7V62_12825 [Thermoleophilia bacterium]